MAVRVRLTTVNRSRSKRRYRGLSMVAAGRVDCLRHLELPRMQSRAFASHVPHLAFLLSAGALLPAPTAAAVPDPPAAIWARAGDASITATWVEALSPGTSPLTGYVATAMPGGASCSVDASPDAMGCRIEGLANGTVYTVRVAAINGSGSSLPSPASDPVAPLAGMEGVNLVGTYGRVRWNDGYVGRLDLGEPEPFPDGIYNAGSYAAFIDNIFTAVEVNSDASSVANCTFSWQFPQVLCDQTAPDEPVGRDSHTHLWKAASSSGITFNNGGGRTGYVVIDLGEVRAATTLRLFQMFSDGKTTGAALSASSATGDEWPVFGDGSWTSLTPMLTVGAGAQSGLSNEYVTCPSVYDFGGTAARYLKLELANNGSYGSGGYIELSSAKLFFEDSPVAVAPDCAPEPPIGIHAVALDSAADVFWTPARGEASGYQIQHSIDGGASWSASATEPAWLDADTRRARVVGLAHDLTYVFRILALSDNGASRYSDQSNPVVTGITIFRNGFEG